MKKSVLFGILASIFVVYFVSNVSASNLILQYSFENSGDVLDMSGNGRVGDRLGATYIEDSFDSDAGQAIYFNGVANRVVVIGSESLSLGATGTTVCAWVQATNLEGSQKEMPVVSKGRTSDRDGIHLGITRQYSSNVHNAYFWFGDNSRHNSQGQFDSTQTVLNEGNLFGPSQLTSRWIFYCGVYNSAAGSVGNKLKIYIDGAAASGAGPAPNIQSTSNPIVIGADYIDGQRENSFEGNMDEVTIWNKSLTAAEIENLHDFYLSQASFTMASCSDEVLSSGDCSQTTEPPEQPEDPEDPETPTPPAPQPASLSSYYSFSKVSTDGTLVEDLKGSRDGKRLAVRINNSFSPRAGEAVQFDGANDRIWFNNTQSSDFGADSSPISFCFYTKYQARSGESEDGRIISKGMTGSNNGFEIIARRNSGQIWAGGSGWAATDSELGDNTWKFVCTTFNGNSEMKIYVDGELQQISLLPEGLPPSIRQTSENLAFGVPYKDGVMNNGNGRAFMGELDEVSIWNGVLTQQEISQLDLIYREMVTTISTGSAADQVCAANPTVSLTCSFTQPGTPTCSDGIMNGAETGVDCGGTCAACQNPPITVSSCTETDVAQDYSLAGSVNVTLSDGETETFSDSCSGKVLTEFFCASSSSYSNVSVVCNGECASGACIGSVSSGPSCAPLTQGGPRINPGTRVQNATGVIYCDPTTLEFLSVRANGQACAQNYQCTSNLCLDGVCTSIVEKLQEQTTLLNQILCALANPTDFLLRNNDGETASNNDYLSCLEDAA